MQIYSKKKKALMRITTTNPQHPQLPVRAYFEIAWTVPRKLASHSNNVWSILMPMMTCLQLPFQPRGIAKRLASKPDLLHRPYLLTKQGRTQHPINNRVPTHHQWHGSASSESSNSTMKELATFVPWQTVPKHLQHNWMKTKACHYLLL